MRDSQITDHNSRELSYFWTENPDLSRTGQDLEDYLQLINSKKPLLVFLAYLHISLPSFCPVFVFFFFPSIFSSLPFPFSCQNKEANLFLECYLLLPSCQVPRLESTTLWRSEIRYRYKMLVWQKRYLFEKWIIPPSQFSSQFSLNQSHLCTKAKNSSNKWITKKFRANYKEKQTKYPTLLFNFFILFD